jgi:hypothetical protein
MLTRNMVRGGGYKGKENCYASAVAYVKVDSHSILCRSKQMKDLLKGVILIEILLSLDLSPDGNSSRWTFHPHSRACFHRFWLCCRKFFQLRTEPQLLTTLNANKIMKCKRTPMIIASHSLNLIQTWIVWFLSKGWSKAGCL